MQLLTLLDVVLGVFFVYLIFSLVATAINESIAAMASSRANWLNKGIRSLFGEVDKKDSNVEAFYASPFISYLNESASALTRRVSYIPATSALKALLTHSPGTQEAGLPLTDAVKNLLGRFPRTSVGLNSAIAALTGGPLHDTLKPLYEKVGGNVDEFMKELDGVLNGIKEGDINEAAENVAGLFKRLTKEMPANWTALQASIESLPAGSPIRAVMKDLVISAQGSIETFEKGFDEWYSSFEKQISSWYRQKTHLVLVVISLGLAVLMNVDTLALVKQLSTDDELRKGVVKQALARVDSNQADIPEAKARDEARAAYQAALKAQKESKDAKEVMKAALTEKKAAAEPASAPASTAASGVAGAASSGAAAASSAATGANSAASAASAVADAADAASAVTRDTVGKAYTTYLSAQEAYEKALQAEVKALEKTGLAFGWEDVWFTELATLWSADPGRACLLLLSKLAGLVLTAAALTLGAPFWFDMLQRVANIRSVGQSLLEQKADEKKVEEKKSN
jgi:hypothetical protein